MALAVYLKTIMAGITKKNISITGKKKTKKKNIQVKTFLYLQKLQNTIFPFKNLKTFPSRILHNFALSSIIHHFHRRKSKT